MFFCWLPGLHAFRYSSCACPAPHGVPRILALMSRSGLCRLGKITRVPLTECAIQLWGALYGTCLPLGVQFSIERL